jgi:hypothetical protein
MHANVNVNVGGKRFQNNGEVIAGVQRWIQVPPKPFFETGIKKLPEGGTSALQSTGAIMKSIV